MNPIKNIEIKNFKSIRHLKIDGCKRINVFIGYPNTGKSNILEALSLFSIDESNLNFSSFVRMENLTTLFHNGEVDKQGEVRINDKHRFVIKFEKSGVIFMRQFEREDTSFVKEDEGGFRLDSNANVLSKTAFQLRDIDKTLVDYKPFSVGNENELSDIRKYDFLKQIDFSDSRYSSLAYPNGNNIFKVISTNKGLRDEIGELFKMNDLSFSYDKTTQDFKILKFVGDEIFLIPYSLIADTLQRLIFYKAAVKSNKETVLLFEEPEAHMFPPYVRKFTSDVIFDKTNQFFIATHSPYVLDALMEEAAEDLSIYLVYYENGETKVKNMSEKDMEEVRNYGVDLFYNLESYLKHGQVNNA